MLLCASFSKAPICKLAASVVVDLTVNGVSHSLCLHPRTSLLAASRDLLDLTGTKKGCDQGQCGGEPK
jgi:xanthine dehydrogenase YagT iron-sulfur-binding subunit